MLYRSKGSIKQYLNALHTNIVNEDYSKNIQNKLREKYGKYLLALDIYETKSSLILSKIELKKEHRGEGIGSNIMEDLINYADENGQIIALTPSADFVDNVNKTKYVNMLTQFYKKFGFKMNKGVNKNFLFRDTMLREPIKVGQKRVNEDSNHEYKSNLEKGYDALKKFLNNKKVETSNVYKILTSNQKLSKEDKKELVNFAVSLGQTAIFLLPGGSIPILAYNIIKNKVKNNEPEEIMENKLVGGRADNETIKDIAKKFRVTVKYLKQQLKKGMKIESEHTEDKEKQKEIASDHLAEFPNYYEELEDVEKKLKKYWKERLKEKVNQPKK